MAAVDPHVYAVVDPDTPGAIATSVAQNERFVSERLRRGERKRTGPPVQRLSEGPQWSRQALSRSRPAQLSRPLVTAPGHGGHGAGHGATHGFHGAERPAGPVSAAASAAGATAFTSRTKSSGVKRTLARRRNSSLLLKIPDLVRLFTIANRRSRIRAQAGWRYRVLPLTDCLP